MYLPCKQMNVLSTDYNDGSKIRFEYLNTYASSKVATTAAKWQRGREALLKVRRRVGLLVRFTFTRRCRPSSASKNKLKKSAKQQPRVTWCQCICLHTTWYEYW